MPVRQSHRNTKKNSSMLCVILYSNTLGDETSAGG